MKILGLDHVGIAVESLDEALELYSGILGMELKGTEVVEAQRVKTAFLPLGASKPVGGPAAGAGGMETELELLESTDPEGPIGKFLANKGPGVQHLAFRVADIDAALAELKGAGMRLIDEVPRYGAGGARIAFLHPKSTKGVLVELCERKA
jgi:methylmalonyl-CoA/ethylmalonyl-CoA epimerase